VSAEIEAVPVGGWLGMMWGAAKVGSECRHARAESDGHGTEQNLFHCLFSAITFETGLLSARSMKRT
jgi:hypothetical protein